MDKTTHRTQMPKTRQITQTPHIVGENLTLTRGGRKIVENVSIAISPGEIVTLIGPNGAGKTSLVRMLLGLISPDSGTITRKPGITIGYVPQRFSVDAIIPLTVERFLKLSGRGGEDERDALLEEVGAARLKDTQISALSGGEFQRVLLAKALMGDPQLLVLDEPAQNVDFSGEADLYQLIEAIRDKRGCGILMISHNLLVVLAASDQVICLNRHVCCSGMPKSVARHPEYMRLFGAKAAQAFAIYSHSHDHEHDLSGKVADSSDSNG